MNKIQTELTLEATAELHGAVSEEIKKEDPSLEQAKRIIDAATIGRGINTGSQQNSSAPRENV